MANESRLDRIKSKQTQEESADIQEATPRVERIKQKKQKAETEETLKTTLGEDAWNFVVQTAYAANKSVTDTIDFFGTDIINGLMGEAGIDARIPSATDALDTYAGESNLQEGLLKDMANMGGQTGMMALSAASLLKRAGTQLPKVLPGESALLGSARQITDISTPVLAAEGGLGVASGYGAEYGKDIGGATGEVIGAVAAPFSVGAAFPKIGRGVVNVAKKLDPANQTTHSIIAKEAITEEAERIIYEQAQRSGMTREEIIKRYNQLGEQGTLADVDPTFAHAVRVVTDQNPKFQGAASRQLKDRAAGQSERVEASLDKSMDTGGRSIESDLDALDERLQPQIRDAYDRAAQKPLRLSPILKSMIESPKGYFKDASRAARKELETKRAAGEQVSHFHIIDEHKKAMDDLIGKAIRNGENQKARNLIQAKNSMLKEVDEAIPEYAEARRLYAGRASLDSAFELGQTFIKPTAKVRDIKAEVEMMTPLEKHYYKLGVKRGFQDIAETENVSRDLVNKYFKKGGSGDKLKILFDDDESYNSFINTIQNETDFSVTKNIVTGGSNTARRLEQMDRMDKKVAKAIIDPSASNTEKVKRVGSIIGDIGKPDNAAKFEAAKLKAGEILTNTGLSKKEIDRILVKGNEKELIDMLNRISPEFNTLHSQTVRTGTAAAATSEN